MTEPILSARQFIGELRDPANGYTESFVQNGATVADPKTYKLVYNTQRWTLLLSGFQVNVTDSATTPEKFFGQAALANGLYFGVMDENDNVLREFGSWVHPDQGLQPGWRMKTTKDFGRFADRQFQRDASGQATDWYILSQSFANLFTGPSLLPAGCTLFARLQDTISVESMTVTATGKLLTRPQC